MILKAKEDFSEKGIKMWDHEVKEVERVLEESKQKMGQPKVFISYSHKDKEWVKEYLLKNLEDNGIKCHIDYRDFERYGNYSLFCKLRHQKYYEE